MKGTVSKGDIRQVRLGIIMFNIFVHTVILNSLKLVVLIKIGVTLLETMV